MGRTRPEYTLRKMFREDMANGYITRAEGSYMSVDQKRK
jgi:hypothetical protein